MERVKMYLERSKRNGMCKKGIEQLRYACSKKDIVDLLLSVQGMEFFCKTIEDGTGIESKVIIDNFGQFMNGNYTRETVYTSQCFCRYKGTVLADKTMFLVYDSCVNFVVPDFMICEIHICGKSSVNVCGNGKANVYTYGNNIELTIPEDCKRRIIEKKHHN